MGLEICSDKSEPSFYLPKRVYHSELLWLFWFKQSLQSKDRASNWMEVTCEHRYPSLKTWARRASVLGFSPQTYCVDDITEPFPLALEEDYDRWRCWHVAKRNFNVLMLRDNTESHLERPWCFCRRWYVTTP